MLFSAKARKLREDESKKEEDESKKATHKKSVSEKGDEHGSTEAAASASSGGAGHGGGESQELPPYTRPATSKFAYVIIHHFRFSEFGQRPVACLLWSLSCFLLAA